MIRTNSTRNKRVCKIDGCDGKHDSHGYCGKHAMRVRKHGDPLYERPKIPRNPKFIVDLVNSKNYTDECVEWPFGTTIDGYGHVTYEGQGQHAHALALKLSTGIWPKDGTHAAHNCGNRLCVNPSHLDWKTPKENNDDKRKHGTWQQGERVGTAKLTDKQAMRILQRCKSGEDPKEIVKDYPVCISLIYSIARRASWRHLDAPD